MSLHGKLVAIASRLAGWLLNFLFLNSNDDLDVVLSTDLGEQQCFQFLRQFVSLNKTKIICCVWPIGNGSLLVVSRHILGVHGNIISAVKRHCCLQTTTI